MNATGRKFNKNTLISEVYARPALWRADDKNFKRRDVTIKLWAEIGKICQLSAIDAKIKWKSLKDQFRRELQKVPPARSKWQYFEMMQFTKHFIATTQTDGSLTKEDFEHDASGEEFNTNDNDDDDDNSDEDEHSCAPSTTSVVGFSSLEPPALIELAAKKPKRKRERVDDTFFQLEQKRVQLLEKVILQNDNPELQFFKSLLPYMDAFPPLEKLQIRIKIQDMVLEHYTKLVESSTEQEIFLKQEPFSPSREDPIV